MATLNILALSSLSIIVHTILGGVGPTEISLLSLNFVHLYKKSERHFSHSLAYDAPKVWNDLPAEIRSASSLACFRKKLDIPIHQSISTIVFFLFLPVVSVVLTLAMSLNYDSCFTTVFVAP